MIDLKSRQRYQEEQKMKRLLNGIPKPEKSKPLGEDEDFLKTMKYIAKRLDFQILVQLQMLKLLKAASKKKKE